MARANPAWLTAPAAPDPSAARPAECCQTDMAPKSRPARTPMLPRMRTVPERSTRSGGTAVERTDGRVRTDWVVMATSPRSPVAGFRRRIEHRSRPYPFGRAAVPVRTGGSSRLSGKRSLLQRAPGDHHGSVTIRQRRDDGARSRVPVLPAVIAVADAVLLLFAVGIWLTRQVPFDDLTDAYLLGNAAIGTGFAAGGALITLRVRHNAVGWLMLAAGSLYLVATAVGSVLYLRLSSGDVGAGSRVLAGV